MMESSLQFRRATKEDLLAIVQLLANDALGAARERVTGTLSVAYIQAFQKIDSDANQELTVAVMNEIIVATFHLTFIQYLTYQGGIRAQIEAVRTHSKYRGRGIGTRLFQYAIQRAKNKGCHLVQLTSDKKRPDAIRFYESLGFEASHEGMKLKL
jgi:ribosomal protein S18 acetylase RimI-like enzyme